MEEIRKKGFFTNSDGIKSTDMVVDPRKKWGKDILMPKKPLSGYIYFATANVNVLKEKEKCSHTDAMKLAGEKWSKMSEKDKKPYSVLHEKDQSRHDKQIKELT